MSTSTMTADYVRNFKADNKGKGLKDILREVSDAWKADKAEAKAARPASEYRSFLQTKLGELSASHPTMPQTERMKLAQEEWKAYKETLPPKEPAAPKDVTKMAPYQRFVAENLEKVRNDMQNATGGKVSAKEAMAKVAAMWKEQKPAKDETPKEKKPRAKKEKTADIEKEEFVA